MMSEWKSSGGRITLFPAALSSATLSALDLYKQVWGQDPDSFQKQANPLQPTVAQGRHGGLTASCLSQPARIDFSLTPPSSDEGMPLVSLPLITDTASLRAELIKITDFIAIGTVKAVVRVALSVQFLALKDSFAEANKAITAVISGEYGVRITEEEDFIFQVNRPHASRTFEDIRVNCITKWSVDRHQILTFALSTGGTPNTAQISSATSPQTDTFITAGINFDINNVPTDTALSPEKPHALLRAALTEVAQMQQAIGLNIEGF
jgi:hypothetical protein